MTHLAKFGYNFPNDCIITRHS